MNKRLGFRPLWAATIGGAIAISAGTPARASLVVDGITYTFFQSTISSTEDQFVLDISGINAATDTEGGRYGVNSLAFTEPSSPGSILSGTMSGFTFMTGGLNAMGCNGTGNFFCFEANTAPGAPALPANSTLQFTFDLTANQANDFAGYNPDFKIQWLGTKSHYNLVSETLTPTLVPLPATLPLLLGAMSALGFIGRRRAA